MNDQPVPPTFHQPGEALVPTKVCPHCGAMSQTALTNCPHCGKDFRGRRWIKVLAILGTVVLLAFAGCVATIAIVADNVIDRVGDEIDKERDKHDITPRQFNSIRFGMTERAVLKKLGVEPQAEGENEDSVGNGTARSRCIYYNVAGGQIVIDTYQLCFRRGRLATKNRL